MSLTYRHGIGAQGNLETLTGQLWTSDTDVFHYLMDLLGSAKGYKRHSFTSNRELDLDLVSFIGLSDTFENIKMTN